MNGQFMNSMEYITQHEANIFVKLSIMHIQFRDSATSLLLPRYSQNPVSNFATYSIDQ